jgi:hypothetical protein
MAGRISALIIALPLVITLGTGCLFDPHPDAGDGDAFEILDLGRDSGPRDMLPVDTEPGDVGPMDLPGADTPPSDVPGDSGGSDACEATALESPFLLEVTAFSFDPEWPNTPEVVSGDAIVLSVGAVDVYGMPARQVMLRMTSDDQEFGIIWNLGLDVRIPVVPGQLVRVYARQAMPWWRDLVVILWDSQGIPLFVAHDAAGGTNWYDCDGLVPCPTIEMLDDDCPAFESTCGTAFHPPVLVLLDGGISSSEIPLGRRQGTNEMGVGGTVRYVVHHAYQQDDMQCVDYPDRWIAAAAVAPGRSDAMGCRCIGHGDCARHEVCETVLRRCVPDLCTPEALALAGRTCGEGRLCDSYTGKCDIDPVSLDSCRTDQDCNSGSLGLCHTAMRECDDTGQCHRPAGGRCIFDMCQVADCASAYCSSLLGRCTNCLSDCDCEGEGTGAFCDFPECRACAADKIAFTQENGPRWDFHELCARGTAEEAEDALRQIDPGINCGMSGIFARCDDGYVACHGTELHRVSPFGMLDDESWGRLCSLSLLDEVVRIAGGHYLD